MTLALSVFDEMYFAWLGRVVWERWRSAVVGCQRSARRCGSGSTVAARRSSAFLHVLSSCVHCHTQTTPLSQLRQGMCVSIKSGSAAGFVWSLHFVFAKVQEILKLWIHLTKSKQEILQMSFPYTPTPWPREISSLVIKSTC